MMTSPYSQSCLLAVMVAVSLGSPADGASYAISSVGKTELVGDSSAVPGGGAQSNFSTGTISVGSSFARFQLLESGTANRFADLKVTLTGVNGTLDTSAGRSGLMIAQTSNSQNLTDAGTLSVLSDFTSVGGNGESSVSLLFEFFTPDSNTLMDVGIELTSFDYDFNQFLEVDTADFGAAAFGSKLSRSDDGSKVRFADTTNSNATFNQSTNAVVLNNRANTSRFTTTVGKVGTGNALFMFEFRDPSTNLDLPLTPISIPEPTIPTMMVVLGVGVCLRRRRED